MISNGILHFNNYLHNLEQQKHRLRLLNQLMEFDVPDGWFDDVDTRSDHIQSVRDLEYLFVVPTGNFRDTIRYQIAMLSTSLQCQRIRDDEFDIDDAALAVTADRALYQQPGIHRLRVDLLNGWDLNHGSSVDVIRQRSYSDQMIIDCIPAIGAYAAQSPALFKRQDGITLPYLEMADLQIGEGHDYVPNYIYFHNSLVFTSRHCEDVSFMYSAPSRIFQ